MPGCDAYRTLGRTGLSVSRIAFGCGFRGIYEKKAAVDAISCAMDHGINFIDCANTYRLRSGIHAEEALGEALKGRRDRFVITSKFGAALDEQNREPNDAGASRVHMLRSVETSLRRLQTDYIDVYLLHLPDDSTGYEELLLGFDQLRREGKIRYAGLCNHRAWQVAAISELGKRMGLCPVSVIQNPYNLLNRAAEEELFPMAEYEGLGVMTYSPLAAGLLSGVFAKGGTCPEKSTWGHDPCYGEYLDHILHGQVSRIVDAVYSLGLKYGVPCAAVASAWLLGSRHVDSIITGADTPEEFEGSFRALGFCLEEEDRALLDRLSAGMREELIHGAVQEKVSRLKAEREA